MPLYTVVSRAQSGVRFPKDAPLTLEQYPSVLGRVDIVVRTRLVHVGGMSKPAPMGLMAEVRGCAPSLNDAVQQFSGVVQSLCPVFTFIGNSPIEDMTPEIGYEVTPGVSERDFFQQFIREERLLILDRRRIPTDLAVRVLRALVSHAEADRIRRALGQYYQALRNWEPGQEVLALAHLWMGAEALTPAVLRRFLTTKSIDRVELAKSWQVEERHLDAETRKRLIMQGDTDAYATARKASDGFEHGFLGFSELRNHSERVRSKVANLLRLAILKELGLSAADEATLCSPPYDQPGHLGFAKYLRGKLVGGTDDLAAPDQAHPFLKWETTFQEMPNPDSEELKIKMSETITGVFAKGVSFKLESTEVWGGQESTLKRDNA